MADQFRWGEGRYEDRYEDRPRQQSYQAADYGRERYRADPQRTSERFGQDYRRGEDRSFHGDGDYVEEANREARYGYGRAEEPSYRPRSNMEAADSMLHRPAYRSPAGDRYGRDYRPDDRYGRDQGDRTAWDRTRDQLASWFGDPEAARRNEQDLERDGRRTDHHVGKGPKGYARSDDRIKEEVSDRLTQDWLLDASEIEVAISGGEITLNGLVADRSDKRRAEDIADRVSGVTHVQNNLRVRQNAPTQAFGHAPADDGLGRLKPTN